MSTPRVLHRIAHDARAHGIQMDVADQLQQVVVMVDQQGLVAALEQMAYASALTVERLSVAKRQILKWPRQRLVTRLQSQMNVVAHQAKAVHAVTETLDAFA